MNPYPLTPYAQSVQDYANHFFDWRWAKWPNQTWRPEMLAEFQSIYGKWVPPK